MFAIFNLYIQGCVATFFGRGDKAAESGDVDYEYHHIIKGLYATFSSWHIDPCRFPIMMLISFKYLALSRF